MTDERWVWWLSTGSSPSKVCGRCGGVKAIDQFVFEDKELRRRHSWCKECFAEYKKDWYVRNREGHIKHVIRNRDKTLRVYRLRIYRYLAEHPCVDCGETDPVVLECDHVRGVKSHEVSVMVSHRFTWAAIEEEIAKCDVRCANDHRRRTARQRGFYERKRTGVGETLGPWLDINAG